MSLTLTNYQDILLSKLSYLDFAKDAKDFTDNYQGKTLWQTILPLREQIKTIEGGNASKKPILSDRMADKRTANIQSIAFFLTGHEN